MGNDYEEIVLFKSKVELPSVLNDLLTRLRKPDFVPTILFEKKLAEKFCNSLQEFVLSKEENETDAVLEAYLYCILLIIKKDGKFITYISSLSDPFFSNLVSIIAKEQSRTSDCGLYSMVLDLIYQIIQSFPFQRQAFTNLLCHVYVVKYITAKKLKDIPRCIQILDLLLEDYTIINEVSSVSTVDSFIAVIDYIIECHSWNQLEISVAFSSLKLLAVVCEKPSLRHYLKQTNFNQTLSKLKNELPQCSKKIQDIVDPLTSPHLNCRRQPILGFNYKTADYSNNVFQMSLSELKVAPRKNHILDFKDVKERKVYCKDQYLEKMESQTNFYWSTPNISEVLMDTTAEIICGMLNSNQGGRIHVGVCKNGRVMGTRISHQERDSLRSGLDFLFSCKLSPFILPHLITIDFIPVMCKGNEAGKGDERFVVHIGIPSGMNTVYYVTNKNTAFCRRGEENVPLNFHEVRQLAVHLTENRYLPIIKHLMEEMKALTLV